MKYMTLFVWAVLLASIIGCSPIEPDNKTVYQHVTKWWHVTSIDALKYNICIPDMVGKDGGEHYAVIPHTREYSVFQHMENGDICITTIAIYRKVPEEPMPAQRPSN